MQVIAKFPLFPPASRPARGQDADGSVIQHVLQKYLQLVFLSVGPINKFFFAALSALWPRHTWMPKSSFNCRPHATELHHDDDLI